VFDEIAGAGVFQQDFDPVRRHRFDVPGQPTVALDQFSDFEVGDEFGVGDGFAEQRRRDIGFGYFFLAPPD
jgi:hypothetical protein